MTDFHLDPSLSAYERFIGTTDGQVEAVIAERTHAFFMGLLSQHGILPEWPGVESYTRQVGPKYTADAPMTDDYISTLIVHDETLGLVLGVVFDRRTERNMHEVTFFTREPTEDLIAWRDAMANHVGSD